MDPPSPQEHSMRIGLQAFYSKEMVGSQAISRFIVGMCGIYSVHGYDSYRVTSDYI